MDSRSGSIKCGLDGGGRCLVVPVASTGNDSVEAEAGPGEPKIVVANRTVGAHNITEVARNTAVVASTVTRAARDIMAEGAHARVELLKDDGLSFDLADLLGDDPLGHLLKDEEALLNDLD